MIHSASGSYGRTDEETCQWRKTGATQMPSRTIDVDGLKVFCRDGGAPGRGTSKSRSTASQHS